MAPLVRLEGGAASAELLRLAASVFELGASVGVDELPGFDPIEPVSLQQLCVRCFQQGPGYSAGPEVDVAAALGTDRILDCDVGDLHSTAGNDYAMDF
jgi:hypothetical protein